MIEYKKVSDSETILTELMIPSYSNFGGKIHDGAVDRNYCWERSV